MYDEIACLRLPVLIVFGKMCDELGMHLGITLCCFFQTQLIFLSSPGFLEVRVGVEVQ